MARVSLYYGTWYKFRGEAALSKEYLERAKNAAKRCMDSKQYSLYPDYRNLFLYPGEDSDEHILSYRYDEASDTYNDRIRSVIIDFRQNQPNLSPMLSFVRMVCLSVSLPIRQNICL